MAVRELQNQVDNFLADAMLPRETETGLVQS